MKLATATPFFYEPGIASTRLVQLALGFVAPSPVDLVDFPNDAGGDVMREMGLPLLAGMDEILVDRAELLLRAGAKDVDVQVTPRDSPDGLGTFLPLPAPARLKKVGLTYTVPAGTPGTVHVVVRAATPQGSGFAAGPPIYAVPPFPAPGPMFGPVLDGMSMSDSGTLKTLTLPSVMGSAWLIQIATGDSIANLAPLAIKPAIQSVTIAALPVNLKVTLAPGAGGADVVLWSHPGLLLPDAGYQTVSFSPLAQKHFAKALKDAASSTGKVTLTAPLQFHSDAACAVEISSKVLQGRFAAHPLATDPLTIPLRGGWEEWTLQAPARLPVAESALRITAKLLGRELNAGSPDPPLDAPSSGLRVNQSISAAVARQFLPLSGQNAGSVLPLVSVRLYLSAVDAAEAVVEIHNDAASTPGPPAGKPLVTQLARNFTGWVEFALAKPLPVSTGQSVLWIVLRSNKGEILWFADPPSGGAGSGPSLKPGLVTANGGKTWGPADAVLATLGDLTAQLFHSVPDPPPPPVIQVRDTTGIIAPNLLQNPVSKPPRQYVSDAALPAALISRLVAAPGTGRVTTTFRLYSRSAADVKFEGMSLFYDPFQAPGGTP